MRHKKDPDDGTRISSWLDEHENERQRLLMGRLVVEYMSRIGEPGFSRMGETGEPGFVTTTPPKET